MTLEELEKDLKVKYERYLILAQANTSHLSESESMKLRIQFQQVEFEYFNADKALRAKVLELMNDEGHNL